MGKHELELHGKLGLPEVGGFAARIEARLKSSWGSRGSELVEAVQADAGITQEELVERLEEDERARDAFLAAGQRAIEVADPHYRAVLGRLVAAALDEAKVDEADHLLRQLIKLEPLHVRVLVTAFDFWRPDGDTEGRFVPASPQDATNVRTHPGIRPEKVAEQLDITPALALAVLEALTSTGLLEGVPDTKPLRYQDMNAPRIVNRATWRPTAWGVDAVLKIFPNLQLFDGRLATFM